MSERGQGIRPESIHAHPKANYSLLEGKHSLKFGYKYQHISTVISNTHPQFGADTYKGLFTEGSNKAKALASTGAADPAYKQAWALADFAFGARSEYELSNNTFVTDNTRYHAAYAQDEHGAYFIRLTVSMQTLGQLRSVQDLTSANPNVAVAGPGIRTETIDGGAAHVFQLQRYGYLMMDRTRDGWIGTVFSIDDAILGMCRLVGREASCLLAPALPPQLAPTASEH